MNMWRKIGATAIGLSGLFFTASRTPRATQSPCRHPTLSPIIAATLVPRDRGYFKQEGLDVETIVIRSAPSVLALAAKEIDFLMTGGGGLSGVLRGLPLRVVFAPLRRPTYALYAKAGDSHHRRTRRQADRHIELRQRPRSAAA